MPRYISYTLSSYTLFNNCFIMQFVFYSIIALIRLKGAGC